MDIYDLFKELMGFKSCWDSSEWLGLNDKGEPILSGSLQLSKDDSYIHGEFKFNGSRWVKN